MLDPDFFRRYRPMPAPFWQWLAIRSWQRQERRSGTRVVFEGLQVPPSTPVIFATNSTQKYDFMPIRVELARRQIPTVTLTKGKNYHWAPMAFLLSRLGVIPLASRGYLLLVDFTGLLGRRPTEDEYRALRSHLDDGTPLPTGEAFARLERTPRRVLGYPFDPTTTGYRALIDQVYAAVMKETLRLTRQAVAAGAHVQIYPEGTAASRLGQGRIGAVELSRALGLPIIPVGISGCREAFGGSGLSLRGGTITVRFGALFKPDLHALPADFQPFVPEHEARHRPVLQAATDALMKEINALLDPAYQHLEGFAADGTQGTERFL